MAALTSKSYQDAAVPQLWSQRSEEVRNQGHDRSHFGSFRSTTTQTPSQVGLPVALGGKFLIATIPMLVASSSKWLWRCRRNSWARHDCAGAAGRSRLSNQTMPQLPFPWRERRRARPRRSTDPASDPGRREHAGVRQESEPGGNHRAHRVSRNTASGGTGSGARCFTRVRFGALARRDVHRPHMHCGSRRGSLFARMASATRGFRMASI